MGNGYRELDRRRIFSVALVVTACPVGAASANPPLLYVHRCCHHAASFDRPRPSGPAIGIGREAAGGGTGVVGFGPPEVGDGARCSETYAAGGAANTPEPLRAQH